MILKTMKIIPKGFSFNTNSQTCLLLPKVSVDVKTTQQPKSEIFGSQNGIARC